MNGVYIWNEGGVYGVNGKIAQIWANKINDTYI